MKEKMKRMEKKSENNFSEIKKKDEAEYIKRVKMILEKNKIEEEKEKNNKKIFLIKEKIKNADERINKYANEIKINDINSNINTLFITQSEKEYNNMRYNSYNLLKSNNILQNFNLIDFLNKKHNISQIKISSS